MTLTTTVTPIEGLTVEERFQNAIALVRMAGVKVRQNVMKCCQGCIEAKDVGFKTTEDFDTKPLLYTYGGQGNAYSWRDGLPYNRTDVRKIEHRGFAMNYDGARVTTFYFGHSGPDLVAATAAAEAFASQGFTVDWDGTTGRKVVVSFEWPEGES